MGGSNTRYESGVRVRLVSNNRYELLHFHAPSKLFDSYNKEAFTRD